MAENKGEPVLSPFIEHRLCSCGKSTIKQVTTILPTGTKILTPMCNECCILLEIGIAKEVKNGKGNITEKKD
jgi:hypothetical protein